MKRILLAILLLPILTMSAEEQIISDLTQTDKDRLTEQRAVIERFLNDTSREKYAKPAGKLGLLRAILEAKKVTKEQTYELQCMGIVLGDAFVQEMNMEWVMVEDSYGRDPAVRMPQTSVIIFPMTMISKRVEKDEEIDVFDLFNGVANIVYERVEEEKK